MSRERAGRESKGARPALCNGQLKHGAIPSTTAGHRDQIAMMTITAATAAVFLIMRNGPREADAARRLDTTFTLPTLHYR